MLLDFLKPNNINDKITQYKNTKDAVLLDVRTSKEYKEGHIEHSINISVDQIARIESVVHNKSTPIFVYCHSGARATSAVQMLEKMGYSMVVNSGGIMSYKEKVIK